jgi:hypothetical protein
MSKATRRSAGEGGIYATADGRLRGTLVLPHPDGTGSVKRYVSGKTRAEVVRKIDALRKLAPSASIGTAPGD